MSKLSDKEHWDSVHVREGETLSETRGQAGVEGRGSFKARVKNALGEKVAGYMSRNYEDYLLWDVIFEKHLPPLEGARVLEVGSAPGDFLARFAEKYKCVPFGVEYSEAGVEVNQNVFRAHGFDPDKVIHADFFSEAFQTPHQGFFDVVISRGFIEHFTDVEDVVRKHVGLLREGGTLILNIPNIRGANFLLTRVFHKELIPIHNLTIMDKGVFNELFNRDHLAARFCGYYGTFNFHLFYTKPDSVMRHVLAACGKSQPLLNLLCRVGFKDRGAESSLFSPSLLFIGTKRGGL